MYLPSPPPARFDPRVARSGGKAAGRASARVCHWYDPVLSPDGKRLAVGIGDSRAEQGNVWVLDLVRGTRTRSDLRAGLGVEPGLVSGFRARRLRPRDRRRQASGIYAKAARAPDAEEQIVAPGRPRRVSDLLVTGWSPDGRRCHRRSSSRREGNYGIWTLPLSGGRKPAAADRYGRSTSTPRVSRRTADGSHTCSASPAGAEIYVQAFPGPRREVSDLDRAAAMSPSGERDGKELFFVVSGRPRHGGARSRPRRPSKPATPRPLFVPESASSSSGSTASRRTASASSSAIPGRRAGRPQRPAGPELDRGAEVDGKNGRCTNANRAVPRRPGLLPRGHRAGLAQDDVAARIAGAAMTQGGASAFLETLTDTVGGRVTGSPQNRAASELILAALKKAGYENAHFEEYPMASRWTRGPASRADPLADRPADHDRLHGVGPGDGRRDPRRRSSTSARRRPSTGRRRPIASAAPPCSWTCSDRRRSGLRHALRPRAQARGGGRRGDAACPPTSRAGWSTRPPSASIRRARCRRSRWRRRTRRCCGGCSRRGPCGSRST